MEINKNPLQKIAVHEMPYSERHLPKSEEAKQEDLAGSETVLT
jgi:hypothetical protein